MLSDSEFGTLDGTSPKTAWQHRTTDAMCCVTGVVLQRPFGEVGVFCCENPEGGMTQQMKQQDTCNRPAASTFDARAPA
jgi:hypothetical protein